MDWPSIFEVGPPRSNMKNRSPQEKKELSYQRDRRNCYGESPHGARKSIPLQKALRNRANRHAQNLPLNLLGHALDEEVADEAESKIHQRAPRDWKKYPDAPLAEVINKKKKDRETMRTQGGRRAPRKLIQPRDA